MKEELQGKLVEILTSIQTAAGKDGDFAMGQLPGVAQEYIALGRAWETLWFVGVLAIAVGITCAIVKSAKTGAVDGEGVFWAGLLNLLAYGIAIGSSKALLLVWFAPKVWLLKEIATLLK